MSDKVTIYGIVVIAIIGAILLGLSLLRLHIDYIQDIQTVNRLYEDGVPVAGTIESVTTFKGSGLRSANSLRIKFTYDVDEKTYRSNSRHEPVVTSFSKNQEIIVVYDPADPSTAEIFDGEVKRGIFPGRIGLFLLIDGAIFIILFVTGIALLMNKKK